jgi:Heterokaryon incompatibility protein (HET)
VSSISYIQNMEFYKHKPFEKLEQVRLLILHSLNESPDEQFYWSIIQPDLESLPHYEAISYTWRTTIQDQHIIVVSSEDGPSSKIRATKSLLEVFARLRLPSEPQTLWIDQICIDQFDWEEKRDQIHYMYRIYQNAARTIIWLGEATKETVESLRVSEALAGIAAGKEVSSTDTVLNPLYALPWFSRLWCIQEVCFSKQPIAMLGAQIINWDTIADVCLATTMPHAEFMPQHNGALMARYRKGI